VVEAFMTITADFYNVEKYSLKWLGVLVCVERTWVQVLCMPNWVYFNYVLFW